MYLTPYYFLFLQLCIICFSRWKGDLYVNSNINVGGVVVPLVTPIRENGDIDYEGLEKIVCRLTDSGVDGFFIAGTTGRFSWFTPKQNSEVCRAVYKLAGNAVTIYGGCCDSGLNRVLDNIDMMQKSGAHTVVVTTPYYLSYNDNEIESALYQIAEKSPLPIVLYDIPEFTRHRMRLEWLEDIADHPNIIGYKDSTNDIRHHLDLLKRTANKNFNVLIGKEHMLCSALKAGAAGLIVSFANAFPEPFINLYKHAKKGSWPEAEKIQDDIINMVNEFELNRNNTEFSSLLYYLEEKINSRGVAIKLI